jgi:hypothetical protein
MEETIELMLQHLFLEDDPQNDTDQQKEVRRQTDQTINMADDKEFTQDEVRQILEGFKDKKAPRPNGITNEIVKIVFKAIPKTMTQMYNECLRTGHFPEKWKVAKVLMITKLGRKEASDPSMYRPISLLNTEGKILEKLLIKRIMHHLYKTEALNGNQYGFSPQKNTVDAATEVRQFIEPHLERGVVAIIASLDIQGAFCSAWWPMILKGLRDAKCPRNLYYLIKDYLKERKATITNKVSMEKKITKGCPQGSCCGLGLWNIQFDPLLKLHYTNHTKVVAFADDLL